MENNFSMKSTFENAYSFYSTILLFGFNNNEKEILEECLKSMSAQDKIKKGKRKIKIYDTNEITDIYGIPYFIAFINFETISEGDKDSLIEFFNELEEPIPNEFIDDSIKEDDLKNSVIYAINFKKSNNVRIPVCMKLKDNIFDNKENLRLTVLSEIKDLEGAGVASTNSNRIYRVLLMYKCLVNEGSLTKQRVDELLYPDNVSTRMFYKDMSIINQIEDGNLVYDRRLKVYKLTR